MKDSEVFYALTIKDIQDVAVTVCDRRLTNDELVRIVSVVEDRIPWFDIVDNAIREADLS